MKRWYQNNPKAKEKRKIYNKKYGKEHKEQIKQKNQEYWNKNKHKLTLAHRMWEKLNPERVAKYRPKIKDRQKLHGFLVKMECFSAYSGYPPKCQCTGCNETTLEFLNIDHINGRKNYGHNRRLGGIKLYLWLMKRNYPKGFRVLCQNCNWARRMYGKTCPHEEAFYPN